MVRFPALGWRVARSANLQADVAQLAEQLIRNQQVLGSSPSVGSKLSSNIDRVIWQKKALDWSLDPEAWEHPWEHPGRDFGHLRTLHRSSLGSDFVLHRSDVVPRHGLNTFLWASIWHAQKAHSARWWSGREWIRALLIR